MDGYKASQVSNCDLASSVTVGYFSLAGAGDFEKLYRYIRNGSSDRRLRFIPNSMVWMAARREELLQCPREIRDL